MFFILSLASIGDIKSYKVKNSIILIGLLSGIICQIIINGTIGIIIWVLGAVFPIVLLGILFYLKAIGAGDIKLFSVIGSFTGIQTVFQIIITAFLFGAVMSIIHIIKNRNFKIRLHYLANYISQIISTKRILPYCQTEEERKGGVIHFTIAIFLGTIFTLLKGELL